MVHKKKYHGGLLAFFLLCCVFFFGNISSSFANISNEFVEYSVNTLKSTYYGTYSTNYKKILNLIDNNLITNITNNINNYLNNNNFGSLNDYNCIITTGDVGSTIMYLKFYLCNNSVSNNIQNIDHYNIILNGKNSTFRSYSNNNIDLIPFINVRIPAGNNNITYLGNVTYEYNLIPTGLTYGYIDLNNYTYNSSSTVLAAPNVVGCGIPLGFLNGSSCILQNITGNYYPVQPEPEEPSGDIPIDTGLGNITNASGDNGGNINLQPIQEGLINIQNQISGDTQKIIDNHNQNTQTIVNAISGEVGKITNTLTNSADDLIDNTIITSGDIESSLNFEIAQDPYSNFWFTLTNNLKTALFGIKRSIDISFQGRTWTISLDEYMVLPAWLVIILTPISTAFFTWVLVRQFKLIFNKLSSGNIDSLLKENSQERHF